MKKNCESPNKLTEFGPFIVDENNKISDLFTRWFSVKQSNQPSSPGLASNSSSRSDIVQNALEDSTSSDSTSQELSYGEREKKVVDTLQDDNLQYEDTSKSQRLINVLKRVKNIVALKSTEGLQSYESTQLRQYWMPDSACYECYDCTESFNTFRRRHHCRLCGQVFCAACCNKKLPGKIINCQGDLKVCTFCCKIILSYLHSPNIEAELTADMRALQVDLQSKFGTNENASSNVGNKKKYSGGYQEERFGASRTSTYNISLSDPDRKEALQSSSSFRALYSELVQPGTGLNFTQHRYRLRSYVEVVFGTDIVHWLIEHEKAGNRNQAQAICQALLDAEYIECSVDENSNEFMEHLLYQAKYKGPLEMNSAQDRGKLPLSSSTFCLDLDVQAHSVYLCRPPTGTDYISDMESPDERNIVAHSEFMPENTCLTDSVISQGSNKSKSALWQSYEQHEDALLAQLLNAVGLLYDHWASLILSLCNQIVEMIRPDECEDSEDMDIRHYVRMKKVPGGSRSDCEIINGIVFSKNVAHRAMRARISEPRILLLQCAIVYQRVEGRLFSLEPVMRQENDYLSNVTARILALKPDIVVVHRNVTRLAQEIFRTNNVTLVLNVKVQVMERIARCTGADIVTSVDTHFGQPRLGTCKEFYVQSFDVKKRSSKSLTFFENCVSPQLGCTVLLRGADKRDLVKLKRVMRLMLLARYNWKLEMAYLMDEFACPPSPKKSLFDSKENSPEDEENPQRSSSNKVGSVGSVNINTEDLVMDNMKKIIGKKSIGNTEDSVMNERDMPKRIITKKCIKPDLEEISQDEDGVRRSAGKHEDKSLKKRVSSSNISESSVDLNGLTAVQGSESRLLVEHVSDFSDPLRSVVSDDEVFELRRKDSLCTMSEQRPFDNRFRLALSHSVLSVSPYLTFPLPYLESEAGRKCSLRKLFPVEMFYSRQFHEDVNAKEPDSPTEENRMDDIKLNPPHPLLSYNISSSKKSADLEALVADFRATGGRLPYNIPYREHSKSAAQTQSDKKNLSERNVDALHPENHQKLSVSLCIHSKHSSNFPGFCVNPRVVNLQFYGRDDIALGKFLNKYCFNPNYLCPSGNCNTPMLQHVRRYIHDTGCIEVSLEQVEKSICKSKDIHTSKSYNADIFIWSWCKQCKNSTAIIPMSNDAKLISFGKYLELRFHGAVYRPQADCGHSLHYDHHQYFLSNGIRTCIKYVSINLWEVCLPPFVIKMSEDATIERAELIDEIRTLSLQGHDVFSGIHDRLNIISGDNDEKSQTSKSFAIRELSVYKARVEHVQVLLAEKAPWTQVADAIVLVKRAVCEACESWNTALQGSDKNAHLRQFPNETGHTLEEELDLEASSVMHDNSSLKFSDSEMSTPHNTPLMIRKIQEIEQNEVCAQSNSSATPKGTARISMPDFTDYLDLDDLERKLFSSIYKPKQKSSASSSIKGSECSTPEMRHHSRTLSDGQPLLDETTESGDKRSLKSMFMHLKSSSNNLIVSHITCPIPVSEHYLLPLGAIPIAVRESEPESIIAYALMSNEYVRSLEDCIKMEAYIKSQDSAAESDEVNSAKEKSEAEKTAKSSSKYQHIEVSFQDSTTNFMCRIYFAHDFERLRDLVLPEGNSRASLARSLSRTTHWAARGGKSGSTFSKTLDDRYILKQMSKLEMQIFCDFAPHYFLYMEGCVSTGTPTLLGKIVGVFRVIYRNAANGAQHQSSMLVMENLFYGQKISRRFDLKGSERNRLVENDSLDDEAVLLDQNFMKMCCDEPLYAHWHSHAVLNDTILRDTDFLSRNSVMDYSLLVGLNQENSMLVVGIIDYIRTFTWDKRLETIVKKTVILGGQGKLPTVLSPDEYRKRFCQAMDRYFVSVPSRWDNLARRFQDPQSNNDKQ